MNCSSQKESHAHLKKSRSLLVHSDCEALESCRLRVKLLWTTCSPLNSHLLPNSATITSFHHLKPLGCIKWPHLKNATSKPLKPIAEFPHFSVTQLMFPFMYLENALIYSFLFICDFKDLMKFFLHWSMWYLRQPNQYSQAVTTHIWFQGKERSLVNFLVKQFSQGLAS